MWDPISEESKAILRFEEQHWKYAGAKNAEIFDRWYWSPTTYYKKLNALIDTPEALAYSPMVVKRLQRLRDARKANRSAARTQSSM